MWVIEFLLPKKGGRSFIDADFWKIWDPSSEENDSPLIPSKSVEDKDLTQDRRPFYHKKWVR